MDALLDSVRKGNLELAEAAIRQLGTANVRDVFSGMSALHEAASNGDCKMIQLLASNGADVNTTNNDSESSPLGVAAVAGHLAACKLLLALGAKLGIHEQDIVNELKEAGEFDIANLLS